MIFLHELRNLLRSKVTLLALTGMWLMGSYGLFHGKKTLDAQKAVIANIAAVQQQHLAQNMAHNQDKPLGTALYFQQFYTINPPSPWAAFSIGQRDVNPFHLPVRMLALQGQLYDTELTNPDTLLTGNLDAAFVFVFLFPLLIIALSYNVLSGEQETGVWKFVQSITLSPRKILLMKLLVRFTITGGLAMLLFATACWYLSLPAGPQLWQVALLILLYLLCWFGITGWVISLGKSSGFNAVALVSVWISCMILLPAMANIVLNNSIPLPEALETTVEQREGYHEKWDRPISETMEQFYRRYPEYRRYPVSHDTFSYSWYYAMQQQGDEASAGAADALFHKLQQRQSWAWRIGYLQPAIHMQQQLNSIAGTDLQDHIGYLQSVRDYHGQLRAYWYPFIFTNAQTATADWQHVPRYQPLSKRKTTLFPGALSLLLITAVCSMAAWWKSSRLFRPS